MRIFATVELRATSTRLFTVGLMSVQFLAQGLTLAGAQNDDPYKFVTLDCVFSKYVVSSIENQKLETKSATDSFALTFSSFDAKKGEAMLIGNAGSDRVLFVPGHQKIMLIQLTDTGNGSMTSISEPRGGRSMAFHTRHMWLLGQPVVSHYHEGICRKR